MSACAFFLFAFFGVCDIFPDIHDVLHFIGFACAPEEKGVCPATLRVMLEADLTLVYDAAGRMITGTFC